MNNNSKDSRSFETKNVEGKKKYQQHIFYIQKSCIIFLCLIRT